MSATEEDTELRDLLIQNLENSGVLNKIKAELRAAVFLALEEQDKVENKTPLVNENLKKSLNTKDGRLVAGLVTDFLQVFNLDFTLAVFQPEISTLNGLDSRETLSKELDISETEVNKNTPLLLELVKRGRHKDKTSVFTEGERLIERTFPKELLPRQIADARKKFDSHDKNRSGEINREAVIGIFADLFPQFSRNMLDSYVTEEFRAKGKDTRNTVDFQDFLGMYKCFFTQCRSVVTSDSSDALYSSSKTTEDKIISFSASKIPRYQGFVKHSSAQEEKADPKAGDRRPGEPLGSQKNRGSVQVSEGTEEGLGDGKNLPTPLRRALEFSLEDEDEGDSFFDDPLPKPQKTYGCGLSSADKPYSGQRHSEKSYSQKDQHWQREGSLSGRSLSQMRRGTSLNDLSAIGSDKEGDGEDMLSDCDNRPSPDSEPRREGLGSSLGKAFTADTQLKSVGGSSESSQKDHSSDKNGSSSSKDKGVKEFPVPSEKTASHLLDDDLYYDDDFNSHRSENSKSEVSIDEEIEEVSIEGPDISDKLGETTQDVSVSQISLGADYMEDVA
ncbi:FGFR1 oncogene partner-like isoform X2 [Sinocyclocheilus anshuiensis]|uniref:FGFR1 oncogene partner-like isoform X2 n=1 Tax=Sinocyclocheilus anshuiensis TaxID=1608454 RepID=UPI0007B98837|nr:PREDICTED: FGFR1 oncogene partner-like isoform X2 [Sinocyclocheilus anshuiensis]